MPSTIVATVGSASANSYATLAEAATYWDNRLNNGAWAIASADNRTRALLMAAKRLDAILMIGRRVDTTQVMEWPRWDVVKPASRLYIGSLGGNPGVAGGYDVDYYLSTEIPPPIKEAQIELAAAYIEGFTEDDNADAISDFSADGISVTLDSAKKKTGLPSQVMRLIQPFLRSPITIRS